MQVYPKFIQHYSSLFVSLTGPSLTAFNHVELIFYLFVVILHFFNSQYTFLEVFS